MPLLPFISVFMFQFVLLLTEGILAIRKDSVFSKHVPHIWKIRAHWVIQLVGVSLVVAAFSIAYENKNRNGWDHFSSWHGKFGLVAFICHLITFVGGTLALYSFDLRRFLKPGINRLLHVLAGVVTYGFGAAAVLLAVYASNWFKNNINDSAGLRMFCFVTLLFSFAWTLLKPLLGSMSRLKSLAS